ncbi:MAG: hypothetical protein JJ863_21240 [Deltaproteobacteria bacterium]|nr:hypothetical protein [Deltaproteobacteria bacterium]
MSERLSNHRQLPLKNQLLDQVTGMSDREWSMEELEATLSLLKERELVDEENRVHPSYQGGMGRYVDRLNAVRLARSRGLRRRGARRVGNLQSAALDHMAEMLRRTG